MGESDLIPDESNLPVPTTAEWQGPYRANWAVLFRSALPPIISVLVLLLVLGWPYWPLLLWLIPLVDPDAKLSLWWTRLGMRHPRYSLKELVPDPAASESFPVRAVFVRNDSAYGEDEGMVTFADGYCHFEGIACWFSVARADCRPLYEVHRETLDLERAATLTYEDETREAQVQFEPIEAYGEWRAMEARLRRAYWAFLSSGGGGGVSRFPPASRQPRSWLLRGANHLKSSSLTIWIGAILLSLFFSPSLSVLARIVLWISIGAPGIPLVIAFVLASMGRGIPRRKYGKHS